MSVRMDGAGIGTPITSLTAPAFSQTFTTITLGNTSAPGSRMLAGRIGTVIFFDRALTDAEVAAVERHLADRWGITLP